MFDEAAQQAKHKGRQKGIRQAAGKFPETVLQLDQLASLETVWQQLDWHPELDAVLVVSDSTQPWTSLRQPATSSESDDKPRGS